MPRPPASPSPPAAAFPFMSGNFDYPHASSSLRPPSRDYEQLQQLFGEREAEWEEHLHGAPEGEDNVIPPGRPRVEPTRRRSLRRQLPSERLPQEPEPPVLRRPPPPASTSNRPRATPSERYLRRSHARLREQRLHDMDSSSDILDSLSDLPVPNPFTVASAMRPRSPISEREGSRREYKRRKLDHEPSRQSQYDGFKYGRKGQVVPGRLRMQIVSCDGGEYEKYRPDGLYPVQNVLKNDKSVYCSERSRCNLVLKHIGEAPFALEKVVIRAPDRGFTAPVQEGLIFVAMSAEDLVSRTSDYNIEYGSPSPRMSPALSSLDDQSLSLREAIGDRSIWENSHRGMEETMEEQIEQLRLRGRTLQMEAAMRANRERQRAERPEPDNQDNDVFGENCDYPADSFFAAAVGVAAPTPPPFTITAESEEESESEEQPSAAIMADRLRRESRWRPDSDEEEDDQLSRFPPPRRAYALELQEPYNERRWVNQRYLDPIRATRLRAPSRIEPKDNQSDSEALISPHARFFIAKHKNKITIKFHPAVSGKFVLLKLWSPTHDGNIDIESVQFYGYSGPRYFPALQPR